MPALTSVRNRTIRTSTELAKAELPNLETIEDTLGIGVLSDGSVTNEYPRNAARITLSFQTITENQGACPLRPSSAFESRIPGGPPPCARPLALRLSRFTHRERPLPLTMPRGSAPLACMRTRVLFLTLALSSLVACSSDSNDADTNGTDATSGIDGDKGKDGNDGNDGADGRDGEDGRDGKDGKNGADGKNSLVRLDEESPGANCPHGGTAVKSGIDANGDGVLDDDEVTHTAYVCAGPKGDGALIRLEDEPPGTNCPHGGTAVKSGIDANGDKILDDDEVTATQYVCNGGVVGAVTITSPEGIAALAGVRHIVGDLTIQGELTGAIVLQDLELVEGTIRVTAPNIEELKLPKLKKAWALDVEHNRHLTVLELNQLTEVAGTIEIESNAALETLDFASLERAGGFSVIQCGAVRSITFPALAEVGTLRIGNPSFGFGGNDSLESFSAPNLVSADAVIVEGNALLTHVDLSALAVVNSSVRIGDDSAHFGEPGNPKLASLAFPSLETVENGFAVLRNVALQSLSLPVLESTGSFSVAASPLLGSLHAPALVTVRGGFGLGRVGYTTGCGSAGDETTGLATLQLSSLASIGGSFCVGGNSELTTLGLPSLKKVEGSAFVVTENPNLPTCAAENLYNQLDSPRPAKKTISGNLGTCP